MVFLQSAKNYAHLLLLALICLAMWMLNVRSAGQLKQPQLALPPDLTGP